jgi:hypothetical protein
MCLCVCPARCEGVMWAASALRRPAESEAERAALRQAAWHPRPRPQRAARRRTRRLRPAPRPQQQRRRRGRRRRSHPPLIAQPRRAETPPAWIAGRSASDTATRTRHCKAQPPRSATQSRSAHADSKVVPGFHGCSGRRTPGLASAADAGWAPRAPARLAAGRPCGDMKRERTLCQARECHVTWAHTGERLLSQSRVAASGDVRRAPRAVGVRAARERWRGAQVATLRCAARTARATRRAARRAGACSMC